MPRSDKQERTALADRQRSARMNAADVTRQQRAAGRMGRYVPGAAGAEIGGLAQASMGTGLSPWMLGSQLSQHRAGMTQAQEIMARADVLGAKAQEIRGMLPYRQDEAFSRSSMMRDQGSAAATAANTDADFRGSIVGPLGQMLASQGRAKETEAKAGFMAQENARFLIPSQAEVNTATAEGLRGGKYVPRGFEPQGDPGDVAKWASAYSTYKKANKVNPAAITTLNQTLTDLKASGNTRAYAATLKTLAEQVGIEFDESIADAGYLDDLAAQILTKLNLEAM